MAALDALLEQASRGFTIPAARRTCPAAGSGR